MESSIRIKNLLFSQFELLTGKQHTSEDKSGELEIYIPPISRIKVGIHNICDNDQVAQLFSCLNINRT